MADLEIRTAARHELGEASAVLSRGMRDNPAHIAVFGHQPEVRRKALRRIFSTMLPLMPHPPLVGLQDGTIVAVWGTADPGKCQPGGLQKLRLLPAVLVCGPRTASRALTWLNEWSSRDLKEPHHHLGPVGVDTHLQGKGIGSRVMAAWCKTLDDNHAVGYLETDKPENVRFYGRFGFEVIEEVAVLDTPNWFMSRPAAG